jgi:hypothetical protein
MWTFDNKLLRTLHSGLTSPQGVHLREEALILTFRNIRSYFWSIFTAALAFSLFGCAKAPSSSAA